MNLASLAYLGGVIIRKMSSHLTSCDGCKATVATDRCDTTLNGLIVNMDLGGLRYPTKTFVGVLESIQNFIQTSLIYLPTSGVKTCLSKYLTPHLLQCRGLQCSLNIGHTAVLADLICTHFIPIVLCNIASATSEKYEKVKYLNAKPLSRKVLKV